MKTYKAIAALVVIVLLAIGGLVFYNLTHASVGAGYVGYLYDRTIELGDPISIAGTSVINKPLTGRVKINPITQDLYVYPTTIVSRSWTATEDEGSPSDEAFRVATKEGKNVITDIYVSVRPQDVGKLIESFGGKDFQQIVNEDLYGLVKGKVSIVTQNISVYDIQSKRTEVQEQVFKLLGETLKTTYGIELVRFEIGNALPPEDIQKKIDQKTEAMNAVELAKLDRQRQDEINQKVVDEQKAASEKEVLERRSKADASAYEAERSAQAAVAVAESEKKQAEIDLEISKLTKEAALEAQKAFTPAYFQNKQLDVYAQAAAKINPSVKTIITNDTGAGFSGLFGIKEILGLDLSN